MPAPAPTVLARVTAELHRRLTAGEYLPGTELPTSSALAAELNASPGTVRRALATLDAAGLTVGRRGRPRITVSPGHAGEATRYEQLAASLRRAIAAGDLPPGGRIPSETTVAAQHDVSRATARRALQLLEADGSIVQRAGRRYVAGASEAPDLAYERLAADLRRRFVTRHPSARFQLPGEQHLSAEYGVSRPTVRKALELLREEGLVHSQPKVGWFITSPPSRSPSLMADPGSPGFSADTTLPAARAACAAIGLAEADLEFLRLGENAIFRVAGSPLVVRVARSLERLGDVEKEMRVARWLEEAGLPAARLAGQAREAPVIALDQYPVTFWQEIIPTSPEPDQADLGRLLRQLHELPCPEWLQLPPFYPFARVAERLDRAPAAADPDDVAVLAQLFTDLQVKYRALDFHFPPSPVHGDAHLGNLMRDESGQALLIDFETFSYGHREWDLTVTGVRRQGFGWLDEEQYGEFTQAYGYDVLDWPGFPVFRSIRELTMTTWLMQLVDDPGANEEFHRRVEDIREGRFPRHWRAF